jgi:hypothetical protein
MGLFDPIDMPGHEKTLQPLRAIVEEYRKDCWTTGEYMPNPRLREAAMRKILQLSQFYTAVMPKNCSIEQPASRFVRGSRSPLIASLDRVPQRRKPGASTTPRQAVDGAGGGGDHTAWTQGGEGR